MMITWIVWFLRFYLAGAVVTAIIVSFTKAPQFIVKPLMTEEEKELRAIMKAYPKTFLFIVASLWPFLFYSILRFTAQGKLK